MPGCRPDATENAGRCTVVARGVPADEGSPSYEVLAALVVSLRRELAGALGTVEETRSLRKKTGRRAGGQAGGAQGHGAGASGASGPGGVP